MVMQLQEVIHLNEEARYHHRLHGVLLVGQGMTCPEVARLLGDAPRSVEYWVKAFEQYGLAGLREGERVGRPRRLSDQQLNEIESAIRRMSEEARPAGNLWDGKALATWIFQKYGIELGVRQCQRLLRQKDFRPHRQRPAMGQTKPERHRVSKNLHSEE